MYTNNFVSDVERLIKERNHLRNIINRAKKLAFRAKQYDRLASGIYNILNEVKDAQGRKI